MRTVTKNVYLLILVGIVSLNACTAPDAPERPTGIVLEIERTGTSLTTLSEIQDELMRIGIGVWPLPLAEVPADVRQLLRQSNLTDEETALVRNRFLLSRERLLEVIAASGRTPNVPGGGVLETVVANQGYSYPQLWVVEEGVDYTRFDRFHVNVSDNGVGVDEVLQMVSGQGVVVRARRPDGTIYTLRLDCASEDACWIFSYNAGLTHIGSLSSATPGTKLVVQAIGPAEWSLRYVD